MKATAILLAVLVTLLMFVGTIHIAANHCALATHKHQSAQDKACIFGCSVSKSAAKSLSSYGLQLLVFLLPMVLLLPVFRRSLLTDNTTINILPLALDRATPPPQPFFFSI